jgi:hypothetical protein
VPFPHATQAELVVSYSPDTQFLNDTSIPIGESMNDILFPYVSSPVILNPKDIAVPGGE